MIIGIEYHGLYVTDEGVNVDTGISTNEFATGADKGYLCGDDINNLPNDALSNIKLAVFVGCNTAGPGPTDKLPRAVVIKGATTAIGFEDTIYTNEANDWVEDFFGKLAQGTNAYDACDELRVEAKYRLNGLDKYVIYGNSELSFR